MNQTMQASCPSLADLGALVMAQYPDRPDLALVAALRLLAAPGGSRGITVAHATGALFSRRAINTMRVPRVPANVNEARDLNRATGGGLLLVGVPEPTIVLIGGGRLLDITTSYRIEDLGVPFRLLHGAARPASEHHRKTVADFAYGVTGVYTPGRVESPLSAALRLSSQLSPLTKRMLDRDVRLLEPAWRQLRESA